MVNLVAATVEPAQAIADVQAVGKLALSVNLVKPDVDPGKDMVVVRSWRDAVASFFP
jgi:hypothetical protein